MRPVQVRSFVPTQDECPQQPILVVFFGNTFKDEGKRTEMIRVIDRRSRFVLAANHFWPAYAVMSEVQDDIFGNSGTVSDIYNIAAKAKSRGWEALMFVDELSWRQHTNIVTNHEEPTLSATVVNITCAPSEVAPSPGSTFYIRRLALLTALEETYLAEPQKPKDWGKLDHRANNHTANLHYRTGLYLYCPWEPIFSPEEFTKLPAQALQANPPLPQEIKIQILNQLRPDEPSCLQELIDTGNNDQDCPELIQPLLPLTEGEVEDIRQAIGKQCPRYDFTMGRWKQNSHATRRDVSRILRHFRQHLHRIIFVLNRPSDDGGLQLAICQSYGYHNLEVWHKLPVESLTVNYPFDMLGQNVQLCRTVQSNKNRELHLDPLWSFPPSQSKWYKTLPFVEPDRERDAGYQSPPSMNHNQYLVFYLTKHLDDEEKRRIRDVVEADEWGNRGFDYVPWDRDEDGGPEDMLRLLKMVGDSTHLGFSTEQDYVLIFIDRLSAVDGRVIICSWRLVLEHGHSGILYGRITDEVESALANIPGNMNLEEFIHDHDHSLTFFQDPDYFGPLDDEDI